MKQVTLFFLLLSGCFALAQEASAGAPERLWYQSALDNGGKLKTSMIKRNMATADATSCGAILKDTWAIAQRHGVKVKVSEELQPSFSMALFHIWADKHSFSCAPDTQLGWEQFGEMGRMHGGFIPLTQDDANQALLFAKNQSEETAPPPSINQTTTAEATVVTEASAEEVSPPPVVTSQPVSQPASSQRLIPFTTVATGELTDVIQHGRRPVPNDAEMKEFLRQREAAERAQAEAEARAAEEAMQREAEASKHHDNNHGGTGSEAKRPWWEYNPEWLQRQEVLPPSSSVEDVIRRYFHDIPDMAEVAFCESTFRHYDENGNVLQGEVNPDDTGTFQVNRFWHEETARAMGLDIENPFDHLVYARHLYETEGLQPWYLSKDCWGSKVGSG